MIGAIVGLCLFAIAIGLVLLAIVTNQLEPNYQTALSIPFYNAGAIVLALVGLALAVVASRRNRELKLARYVMVAGIVCVILLIALFPLSNAGLLSAVR